MKKTFIFITLILLAAYSLPALSQQNPPGTDWKSIKAGNYEIIFPNELTPLGQRVANLMIHYENYNDLPPKSVPII